MWSNSIRCVLHSIELLVGGFTNTILRIPSSLRRDYIIWYQSLRIQREVSKPILLFSIFDLLFVFQGLCCINLPIVLTCVLSLKVAGFSLVRRKKNVAKEEEEIRNPKPNLFPFLFWNFLLFPFKTFLISS